MPYALVLILGDFGWIYGSVKYFTAV